MKPSLQFRLSQHLTLTPQLQQSIKLLQLSTIELNQEIERVLMDNPVLEREDGHDEHEGSAGPASSLAGTASSLASPSPGSTSPAESPAESQADRASDTDWPVDVPVSWRGGEDDEEGDRSFAAADTPTLSEHLRTQLSLTNL